MAFPTLHRGTDVTILSGDGATPTEHFTLICIATTKNFSRKVETDDHMEIDCANPTNLPSRIVVGKAQTFDLSISGRCDFSKFAVLEAELDGNTHNFQIARAGTGANGGGTFQGAFVITDLTQGVADNATVTFSATLKGQGVVTFTANA